MDKLNNYFKKYRIVLGSSSKGRMSILNKCGCDVYAICVPGIDEKSIRNSDPYQLTKNITIAKNDACQKLWNAKDDLPVILITSDCIVYFNGEIFEKPLNEQEAEKFINSYAKANYPAEIITTTIVSCSNLEGVYEIGSKMSEITFKPFDNITVKKILDNRSIYNCCGGLLIEDNDFLNLYAVTKGSYNHVLGLCPDELYELISNLVNRLNPSEKKLLEK